ncbi:MAG: efflux RND transporter periplasmic adaptor subunit [Mangrovibacterium sp.]
MKTLVRMVIGMTGVVWVSACSPHPDKVTNQEKVTVKIYSPETFTEDGIRLSGQVMAGKTATISTRIMGFVHQVSVKPGDRVKTGQLLIAIGNEDLLAKKAQAEATIREAEAAARNARRDLERFKVLHAQKSVSDKELENVSLQSVSADARLQMARQALNEVNVNLSYTNIIAPFAGVVTRKMIDEGSMANPGVPLLVLEQEGELQVQASVPETYIPFVKTGDQALVRLNATEATTTGVITELSPSASGTGGQYLMKLSIGGKRESGIQPGMFAHIFIGKESQNDGNNLRLLISKSSVVYRDQLTGVYTVNGHNQAILKWIRLGSPKGDQVEVISGLNATDKIISEVGMKLYNGILVHISQN